MRTAAICVALALAICIAAPALAQAPSPPPDAAADQPPVPVGEVIALRDLLNDLGRRLASLEAHSGGSDDAELQSLRLLLKDVDRRVRVLEGLPAAASLNAPLPLPEAPVPTIPLPGMSANAAGAAVSSAKAAAQLAEQTGEETGLWPAPYPNERTPPDADKLDFYGSFRVRFAVSETNTEIADRFSRAGVSKAIRWGDRWRMRGFGRIEFGFNMVNNNPVFITGGDPGFSVGQGGQVLGTRLGYVGLDTPVGTVSFGKQWSVYSDVSGFTDQFATYGGDASGTYNAGTDGGISGTGRAETAMQYRNKWGPVALGVQAQFRARTSEAKRFADTWGASLVTNASKHFNAGIAYNQVRDGVEAPEPNQPKQGDESAVAGLRYLRHPLTVALTYHRSRNHETDDRGAYYDAEGTELYGQFDFTTRWFTWGGYNFLRPQKDGASGDFRVKYYLGGIGYRWREDRAVVIEAKFEDSKGVSGQPTSKSVVTIGTNVGW